MGKGKEGMVGRGSSAKLMLHNGGKMGCFERKKYKGVIFLYGMGTQGKGKRKRGPFCKSAVGE